MKYNKLAIHVEIQISCRISNAIVVGVGAENENGEDDISVSQQVGKGGHDRVIPKFSHPSPLITNAMSYSCILADPMNVPYGWVE